MLALALFACPLIALTQGLSNFNGEYGIKQNNRNEVYFYLQKERNRVYSDQESFFKNLLKLSQDDIFKLYKKGKDQYGKTFERYYQLFKGIPVENGMFILHRDIDGVIESANGNFIRTTDLNIIPSINRREALIICCKHLKINFKDEYLDKSKIDLVIIDLNKENEKATFSQIVLAYKIVLYSGSGISESVIYINAHSGEICFTEPRINYFYTGINVDSNTELNKVSIISYPMPNPANGSFATRYSGNQTAKTESKNGAYYLEDYTRSNGILTLDLHNYEIEQLSLSSPIFSYDNQWDSVDFPEDEYGDAALDVHWGIQQVYSFFESNYGREGWDSTVQDIKAYVHACSESKGKDQAFYEDSLKILAFGDGDHLFHPLVSLDVVAHEYAHAINDFTSQFGGTTTMSAFNEGLSDIWAAVLENSINTNRPKNIWQMGDGVVLVDSCIRNLENTMDGNAKTQMLDTYGTSNYQDSESAYVRSGVLSHWFYLLSEGGQGTNDIDNDYCVYGIGIDNSADLVYFAQDGEYLNGATDYPYLQTYFDNALNLMFGTNSLEALQVANAWYAVGVGSEPLQMSIAGNSTVCKYGAKFKIENVPAGCSVTWTCDSRMHLSSTSGDSIVVFADQSGTGGWVKATVSSSYSSVDVEYNDITINASTPTISGSAVICSSGTTFTLSASCAYDSIKWTKDSYLNITSGQGTLSCSFAATGDGSSTVYATIYLSGTYSTYSKSVWAGKPVFTSISGPSPFYDEYGCTGQPYNFWAYPARDALSQSSYQWMVEPSWYDWYFQYQYYDWVTIVFNDPYEYYQVIARATNACGATNWVYKNVSITDCYRYSMYPNPASEYVTITLTVDESVKKEEVPSNILVRITDNSGITYYSGTKGGDSFTLPVSNLKDGSYIVSIIYDGKIENLPLIFKK